VSVPDHEQGGDPACWLHEFEERQAVIADLAGIDEDGGVVWSLPHDGDLDANLVRLGPEAEIAEHVNDELDVLLVVSAGGGELIVDSVAHVLNESTVALLPAGTRRAIRAGADGLAYLSVHRRRGPLGVKGIAQR
jgi:quercetin dioxygenase-like cupin family protein